MSVSTDATTGLHAISQDRWPADGLAEASRSSRAPDLFVPAAWAHLGRALATKLDPGWRMIAGVIFASGITVPARFYVRWVSLHFLTIYEAA